MSAFPESGRSSLVNFGENRVRFRLVIPTMTDHLVESRHRIWGGIFDADKGVAQYPFSELNLQFSSVRPLQIMENN